MKRSEKLSNMRKEYIDKKNELKNVPKIGFEVYIEFDYILNVDINWIIKKIRESIIEEAELTEEQPKHVILTFDIEELRSGKNIEMFLTPGVVEGIVNFAQGVAIVVIGELIVRSIINLREKQLSRGTRNNIRRIRIRRKTKYPDGREEYSDEDFHF